MRMKFRPPQPNGGELRLASVGLSGRMLMDLLTPRERRGFYVLAVIMLLVAVLETAGIASILPFMAVLAEPARIEHSHQLAAVYHGLGFQSVNAFLVALGLATFLMTIAGISMHVLSIFSISRFTTRCSYMLSCQLLEGYLNQPYSWFLDRHSADLGKAVLSEVDNVVSQSFLPAMTLLSNLVVTLFIAAFLIVLQPWVALGTALVLVASYGLIFLVARKYLIRFGEIRFAANAERYKIAHEATAGIKDVKLLGLEARYLRRFQIPARRLARVSATRVLIAQTPRYLLQAVAFGGMLLIILGMLLARSASLGAILPLLAVYAFAGLRLLPAVQQIHEQVTSLRYNQPALVSLHKDLMEIRVRAAQPVETSDEPVHLRERLELADVHFSYPLSERKALDGLSLSIPARTTVGIVGGTGAGKTTAVDLMLGLLEMQQGALLVDGQPITPRNVRAWQNTIGYVPQAIFLTDDTVSANIAFGIPPGQIDHAAVEARRGRRDRQFRHGGAAAGLRYPGRRAWHPAVGRPAPAHRHRQGALPRPGRADHGRGDLGPRQSDRAGGDGRGAQPRPRQDDHPDRPPADHGAGLRHHLHARARAADRPGPLQRAAQLSRKFRAMAVGHG